ncbi:DUF6311 domain-containing protein [Limnobacter parvus]|uniref:DUF6311 domain-containing protein n=1 Tax=Limnobacter parvus TaxID=2939690 RepID=A0ABT1XGJ8_9BURK|nr:DUF6311 domain-containing protein [Limnobacter parvus]MCR2745234.1 DUF6311 domain-containing protein [Limnobacter parvus]
MTRSNLFLRLSAYVTAPILGAVIFLYVVGVDVLNPYNTDILLFGDTAAHYAGWSFYYLSPFGFPIGVNPSFGIEISSSIVFSDAIPLVAIPAKFIGQLLGIDPFQYFGAWLLCSFILQAVFSWLLIGQFELRYTHRLLCTALLTFSLPMIWRLQGHFSLTAHYLLLASIVLVFAQDGKRQLWPWALLLAAATLTHAYFVAMVGALWFADLCRAKWDGWRPSKAWVGEFIFMVTTVGVVAYLAGYFVVSSGAALIGYGTYKLNLLSLFDPDESWSTILPDIPNAGRGEYEGFAFLGLGGLFLLGLSFARPKALVQSLRTFFIEYWFLTLVLVVLVLYAITPAVGFGPYSAGKVPDVFERMFAVFRASGRFVWPAYYFIFLACLIFVCKRYPQVASISLLFIALTLQVVDSSQMTSQLNTFLSSVSGAKRAEIRLRGPLWDHLGAKYKKIRRLPTANISEGWLPLALYASQNKMQTDIVYLARVDQKSLTKLHQESMNIATMGDFDPDTLYVLDESVFAKISRTVREGDFIFRMDGYTLLAPNCSDCSTKAPKGVEILKPDELVPRFSKDDIIEFSYSGMGKIFLNDGWSQPEHWGVWQDGQEASLTIPLFKSDVEALSLSFLGFNGTLQRPLDVSVYIDGKPWRTVSIIDNTPQILNISLQELGKNCRLALCEVGITFVTKNTSRPIDLGTGNDPRRLGVGLTDLTFQ